MIKDLYYNYGIKEIQFRDDNFTVNKKRVQTFCEKLIQEKLDIVWSCVARVDMIDEEILKIMKKAGCWVIWFGFESGSQEILDVIKKKVSLDQAINTVIITRKAGIEVGGFFMLGCPNETEKTIKKTINYLLKLNLNDFHISFFTPFPGSEIYKSYAMYGKFKNDWKKLNGWYPVFVPWGLNENLMIKFSKYAFRKFYLRPKIIFQYLLRIKSLKVLKAYLSGLLALLELLMKKKEI